MRCRVLVSLLLFVSAFIHAEWRQTSTEHFRFIYRAEYEYAARELVSFADEVYGEVAPLFNAAPQTVTAVIFGGTDVANGYYSPNPPQHIGLFVVQPASTWMGPGVESWLRYLLVHELTHYLQANHRPGFLEALGSLFGSSIGALDVGLVPLWFTEGLAIHAETEHTGGGRQSDPAFELYERALTLDNQLFSLEQAGYSSYLAPPGRQYVAGKFLIEYMMDEYGESFVRQFMDDFSAFPLFGMWGAIERTTGDSMAEIYEDAVGWLSKQYDNYRTLPQGEQISPEGRADYYLPVETDQGWYLYRSRPDRRTGIVRFDQTGEQMLLPVRLTEPSSWSVTADGNLIAFATISLDRTADEAAVSVNVAAPLKSNLFVHDLENGTTTQITEGGGFYYPRVAPDGNSIVAVERYQGHHRIVEIPLAPDSERRIIASRSATRYYNPVLSRDGRRIAVTENESGLQQILLVDRATGASERLPLPEGSGPPRFPRFSDDSTLLYVVAFGGTLSLVRHEIGSGNIQIIGEDRVGISEAVHITDQIIYRSYSADGTVLRELGEQRPQSLRPRTPVVPPPVEMLPSIPSRPFTPVAWPRFWLPIAGLSGGVPDITYLGGGVAISGQDVLGTTMWTTQALYFPALSQLGYDVLLSTRRGPFSGALSAGSSYSPVASTAGTYYLQRFTQGLSVTYDLLNDFYLGTSRRFGLSADLSAEFRAAAPVPFGIRELSTSLVTPQTPLLIPTLGFVAARSPSAASDAAAAPWAFGLRGAFSVPIALNSGELETHFISATGVLNLGLGGSHVLRVEQQLSWASNQQYRLPFQLRGFGPRTVTTTSGPGHFKLSFDYLPPHLLTDVPLFSSVGITRVGLELFAELTGGFSLETGTVALDEAVGLGAGVTTVVTYLVDWPVTIGVAARYRPDSSTAFNPTDVSFYFDLNLSGLLGVIGSTFWRSDETFDLTHNHIRMRGRSFGE